MTPFAGFKELRQNNCRGFLFTVWFHGYHSADMCKLSFVAFFPQALWQVNGHDFIHVDPQTVQPLLKNIISGSVWPTYRRHFARTQLVGLSALSATILQWKCVCTFPVPIGAMEQHIFLGSPSNSGPPQFRYSIWGEWNERFFQSQNIMGNLPPCGISFGGHFWGGAKQKRDSGKICHSITRPQKWNSTSGETQESMGDSGKISHSACQLRLRKALGLWQNIWFRYPPPPQAKQHIRRDSEVCLFKNRIQVSPYLIELLVSVIPVLVSTLNGWKARLKTSRVAGISGNASLGKKAALLQNTAILRGMSGSCG